MRDRNEMLQMIKEKVRETEPGATLILYGSYARGEEHEDSDIDVLILVNRDEEKMTWKERTEVAVQLNPVEWEIGVPISPVVYSKVGWANHRVTPYYENVNREGIVL
jgi:predicted nucleotidyltransferase